MLPAGRGARARRRAGVRRHDEAGGDARGGRRRRRDDQRRRRAAASPGALEAAAATDAAVCLMHMQGEPRTMQDAAPLRRRRCRGARLPRRARAGLRAGGHRARAHRARPGLRLRQGAGAQLRAAAGSRHAGRGRATRCSAGLVAQVVAGSRHRPAGGRAARGSLAAALACVARGARLVRVHDVRETVDALEVWQAALDPDSLRVSG